VDGDVQFSDQYRTITACHIASNYAADSFDCVSNCDRAEEGLLIAERSDDQSVRTLSPGTSHSTLDEANESK